MWNNFVLSVSLYSKSHTWIGKVIFKNRINKYQLTLRFLQRGKQNILFSAFKMKDSTCIYYCE